MKKTASVLILIGALALGGCAAATPEPPTPLEVAVASCEAETPPTKIGDVEGPFTAEEACALILANHWRIMGKDEGTEEFIYKYAE